MRFLSTCQRLIRNADGHIDDIEAYAETANLGIALYVENYPVLKLLRLASFGIKLSENAAAQFEQLLTIYMELTAAPINKPGFN